METKKVIGYCRISSTKGKKNVNKDDSNNSIEAQTQKIKDYCKFKGFELIEIFIDSDVSGGTDFSKRVGGKAATDLLTNSDIKTIIGTRPCRFFRDTSNALIITDEWNKKGIELHLIDAGGNTINTKTAIGRLMFTIVIANGEFERLSAGERTATVLRHKRDNKKAYCAQVFGYDKQNGELIPNETEQKVIMLIKSELLTNDVKSVCKKLNRMGYTTKGGNKWRREAIERVINNPLNQDKINSLEYQSLN